MAAAYCLVDVTENCLVVAFLRGYEGVAGAIGWLQIPKVALFVGAGACLAFAVAGALL